MAADFQKSYLQIGRLLGNVPGLSVPDCRKPEALLWLGRLHAAVNEAGLSTDAAMLVVETNRMGGISWNPTDILAIAYRALAHCEARAPAAAAGSFIPVGNAFDAYASLAKIFQSATSDVLIVDPYLDEVVLTEFAASLPEGIRLRLLADQDTHKASLGPAAVRWVAQYGTKRPLSVRLATPRALHDRAIFIDTTRAWTLTQSLKDFAKRSPAEIVRADDTAVLKINAYESIWAGATVLA